MCNKLKVNKLILYRGSQPHGLSDGGGEVGIQSPHDYLAQNEKKIKKKIKNLNQRGRPEGKGCLPQ